MSGQLIFVRLSTSDPTARCVVQIDHRERGDRSVAFGRSAFRDLASRGFKLYNQGSNIMPSSP